MTYCSNCDNTVAKANIKVDPDGYCPKCHRAIDVKSTLSPADPVQLAIDHWEYIYSTIHAHTGMEVESKEYVTNMHHYTTAFIHGFKHGKDSK